MKEQDAKGHNIKKAQEMIKDAAAYDRATYDEAADAIVNLEVQPLPTNYTLPEINDAIHLVSERSPESASVLSFLGELRQEAIVRNQKSSQAQPEKQSRKLPSLRSHLPEALVPAVKRVARLAPVTIFVASAANFGVGAIGIGDTFSDIGNTSGWTEAAKLNKPLYDLRVASAQSIPLMEGKVQQFFGADPVVRYPNGHLIRTSLSDAREKLASNTDINPETIGRLKEIEDSMPDQVEIKEYDGKVIIDETTFRSQYDAIDEIHAEVQQVNQHYLDQIPTDLWKRLYAHLGALFASTLGFSWIGTALYSKFTEWEQKQRRKDYSYNIPNPAGRYLPNKYIQQ